MPNFLEDYEPVEDRLARFWTDWPGGRVVTVLLEPRAEGQYIVRAELFTDGEQFPAASGYAEEREGSSVVNKTSALENCETSAIGRALANLGYAAKGKRPSREEMSKASADGEAAATGPGEGKTEEHIASPGSTTKDAPGPPHYPLNPAECDHNSERTGHRLRPRKSPRGPVCPRCGLSYIAIVES